ncbi:MAG: hypothetical protein KIT15_01175 [Xanthobacteraceae bacterium]|nr:hypothetical protein [Xanthobacteraceae bacterium]MCW5673166.1 hypothetical protein [Xanthobacteraceae bacterium]
MSQYPIPQDKQQAFVSFAPQGAEREKVSAERVRELISSVWVQSSERVVAGVAFNKFDIVGQLDLSNLGDANHPLPRLIFHSCQFDQIRAHSATMLGMYVEASEGASVHLLHCDVLVGININETKLSDAVPVCISDCKVGGQVLLMGVATAPEADKTILFDLENLSADSLSIDGCKSGQTLDISNADISSSLIVHDCTFSSNDALVALRLGNLKVGGYVRFSNCTIAGQVFGNTVSAGSHFQFANVKGRIEKGNWLLCDKFEIGGSVQFDAVDIVGQLTVLSGTVGLNIRVSNSMFRATQSGYELFSFYRLKLGGALHLDAGSTFDGASRFNDCSFKNIYVNKCEFTKQKSWALSIWGCEVTGDTKISDVKTAGELIFSESKLAVVDFSNLKFVPEKPSQSTKRGQIVFETIDLSSTKIDKLNLDLPTITTAGDTIVVDLSASEIGAIKYRKDDYYVKGVDGGEHWLLRFFSSMANVFARFNAEPRKTRFIWEGCKYNYKSADDAEWARNVEDIAWSRSYRTYQRRENTTQPYAFLAEYLRKIGLEHLSDRVILEMKRDVRRRHETGLGRFWSWLFDIFFGYGYSKLRAAITLILWVVVGSYFTAIALERGALVLDTQVVSTYVARPGGTQEPRPVLPLNPQENSIAEPIPCAGSVDPTLYAIDLMIPLHDFGQAKVCTLKSASNVLSGALQLDEISMWWIGKYLYTMFGWLIVSLVLLTFTGTLKART